MSLTKKPQSTTNPNRSPFDRARDGPSRTARSWWTTCIGRASFPRHLSRQRRRLPGGGFQQTVSATNVTSCSPRMWLRWPGTPHSPVCVKTRRLLP